jgi:pimeloyl-ACP methyl ester carboxylesterase
VAGFAGSPPAGNAGTGEVVAPMVEDIAKYIASHKLKSPAFIGHSLGGESGLMLAERHPDLVGRLMVVDAFPFISVLFFGPTATPDSVKPQAAMIRDKTMAAKGDERIASSTQVINTMVATESARPAVLKATLDSDPSVSGRAMYDLMVTDLTPDLPKITCPTTVLHAYNKYFPVPAETADSWYAGAYAGLKGVKLVRIEPSFHFIMIDQPEKFTAEVDAFLA